MSVIEYEEKAEVQNQSRQWQGFAQSGIYLKQAGQQFKRVLLAAIVPALIFVLWNYAYRHQWLPEQILPSPQLVWQTFVELWQSGELPDNLRISVKRIGWSVLAGGSLGLFLGFAVGLSKRAYLYLYPTFNLIAQFPVIGWIPLLLIFLGIGESLKIVAISLAVVVPVMVATYKSVLNVSPKLLEVAQVYDYSQWQTLQKIIIPAALPSIVGGLRQGVMQAWLSLVFVELLASSEGIGYLLVWGRQLLQPDIVYMAIIVIGLIGYALDNVLRLIEQHFNRWQRKAF